MGFSHFIFGYGSLICPNSRAITAPTLKSRSATPVKVKHLERLWSLPIPEAGMTAMGIRYKANAECVGVLVPVNEEELERFDIRETGYIRVPIDHAHVERISFLPPEEHYGGSYCYFEQLDKSSSSSPESESSSLPQVWVYLQENPQPISKECPIAQTYVDIILRGCLSISPDFARDFLLSTQGWHPDQFHDDSAVVYSGSCCRGSGTCNAITSLGEDEEKEQKEEEDATGAAKTPTAFWVNDRHNPLYVRADVEYSKEKGHELDRMLELYRPEIAHRRHFYGRSFTV